MEEMISFCNLVKDCSEWTAPFRCEQPSPRSELAMSCGGSRGCPPVEQGSTNMRTRAGSNNQAGRLPGGGGEGRRSWHFVLGRPKQEDWLRGHEGCAICQGTAHGRQALKQPRQKYGREEGLRGSDSLADWVRASGQAWWAVGGVAKPSVDVD